MDYFIVVKTDSPPEEWPTDTRLTFADAVRRADQMWDEYWDDDGWASGAELGTEDANGDDPLVRVVVHHRPSNRVCYMRGNPNHDDFQS